MTIENHSEERPSPGKILERDKKGPKASLVEPEVKDTADAAKRADATAKAAVERGDAEAKKGKSAVLTSMPDYEEIGKIAVASAKQKIAEAGLKWSDRLEEDVRIEAKLKHDKYLGQLKLLLTGDFVGWDGRTFIEDDGGLINAEKFLDYPILKNILGLPPEATAKGFFPGLGKLELKDGDHLLISPDKKSVVIVCDNNPKGSMAFMAGKYQKVTEVARNDAQVEKNIAQALGYKIDNGRIKFTSRRAAADKTLGAIAKEQKWGEALVVDGKLAVRGQKDEYYNVKKQPDGTYGLEKQRVFALNGTKVDEKIPASMATIVRGINTNRRA